MRARLDEGSCRRYQITDRGKYPSKSQSYHHLRVLRAHQGSVHEVVESVFLESIFFDSWERLRRVATKMPREEKAADQKSLNLIFKGYREDFQSDL